MDPAQREPALQQVIERINRQYGKGTILLAGEKIAQVPVVSTGSLLIDQAIGIGGLPLGRIVEIIAPESAGKTTLCLQTIANAQKKGLETAYIDMEHSLDLGYAKRLGVDTSRMILSQCDYGEQALNIVKTLVESGKLSVIVVDSVSALVPRKELEGEIGDSTIGKQALMMSQALRILTPLAEKHNTLIIFINQIRIKVGVLYGSPETGSGGEALKFFSSVRIDMRKQIDKEGGGTKIKVRIIKNKLAPPFGEAHVYLEWGNGICRTGEIIALAAEAGILQKSGSWYAYGQTRLGNGEDAVRKVLEDNEQLLAEVEQKVLLTLKK